MLPTSSGFHFFRDIRQYYAAYRHSPSEKDLLKNKYLWDDVYNVWNKNNNTMENLSALSGFYLKNFQKAFPEEDIQEWSPLCYPWVFEDYYIDPFEYVTTTIAAIREQKNQENT